MATHCCVLAWRIPGTGEPGGLPSCGVAQSQTRLTRLSSSSSSYWRCCVYTSSCVCLMCVMSCFLLFAENLPCALDQSVLDHLIYYLNMYHLIYYHNIRIR